MISVLTFGPRFAGSNLVKGTGFLMAIKSLAQLLSEGK
jgi:hypothetical protein